MRTRKPVPVHNLKVSRRGRVKKRTVLWRWRRAFYLAALALAVGASGLIYVLGQVELPEDPRQAPPQQQTSFICAADVQVNCSAQNAMAQLHGSEDRELVTYGQIPDVLRQAVVATEDKDFFTHDGVDPLGIARAAAADLRGTGVRQGGSTITQQYVKKTYLSSEPTATRKIKEAVMAVKLEQDLSKREILTRYLNTVYFGRGAYGVQAASRSWFRHDVEALNAGEAAFLAGLLRLPTGADPYKGEAGVKEAERRRRISLDLMRQEGYLSAKEVRVLTAVPVRPKSDGGLGLVKPPPKTSNLGEKVKGSEWGSEYFVEHVRKWLLAEFGSATVSRGGLKVYTTLDLGMQQQAYEAVTSTLDRPGDPAGALVAIDDQGQVKAMMAGKDYGADKKKTNLATGRQGGGLGRQPGSTFKPFALAAAVQDGYSVESVLPSPGKIEITDPRCLTPGERAWTVKGGPGGSSSLVSATKESMNTVYAQLMTRLGPARVVKMARELGVTARVPELCSVVLGAGEVSVLDMAGAYSTFANQGVRKDPVVVTRVEFPDGTEERFTSTQTQVLTPEQAGRVTFSLQQVIKGGTGATADFGRPAAGKTGTTQQNADSWFVGYTPKLTTAVWMGFPDGLIPMTDVHGIEVQGGTFPAEMWRKFMTAATAGFETGDFPTLAPDVLGAGETLDSNYGRSTAIVGGGSTVPTTTTTTQPGRTPSSTTPSSTTPRSTSTSTIPATSIAPVTSAPPATTGPASTTPATTTSAAGG